PQAVPGVSRVAVLWNPGDSPNTEKDTLKRAEAAGRALGVRVQFVEARGPADFDRAFSDMTRARAGALTVLPSPMFFNERRHLVDLAAKNRLPAVYASRDYVDAGGLMAYGPNFADMFRRAATYVDKILKGAKPADLPVEQPTKFELVINLKAAKALGLTIPQSVLGRADEVIDRRRFLTGTGAVLLVAPVAAEAQQAAKVARIGYLAGNVSASPHLNEAFRQGLRDLGYVEGRNVVIEYRDAEGKLERLPALAAELVALKVDVIVAGGTPQALAAKQATRTLPIVFAAAADPVASGLVTSLARPGGNVTGLSQQTSELVGKCLEQLKQAVPGVTRVAVLWQPGAFGERTEKDMLKGVEVAARALGVRLQFVEARGPADFDRAFSDMTRARAGALTVLTSTMFVNERRRLVDLAAKNRLPAVYPWREGVDAGGLMSYGPNLPDLFRRAATYVDRILKGTKPADLPVEQPTKFELVINLKAAKALGLTIPPSLLGRADHVVE
ncbi:MAG TPA: ABC transporter substrate-binding protein, partial [Methylomirabilota bacterium]|nr:ABC transporter substrate-binding protein [Methylomirabilota bacterium]